MIKSLQRIWLICLYISTISLAGCFHIPDEDWLLNKGKVQEKNTERDELINAVDSLVLWVSSISSQREEYKNIDNTVENIVDKNTEDITNEWSAITEEWVDEDLFLQSLDSNLLEQIAKNLQLVIDEEKKEEQENPSILFTEWWTRVFQKDQYKEVIKLWKDAIKPLYWILYKSEANWLYEYLCAMAIQDISWLSFPDENWSQWRSNAKQFLSLFTEYILNSKS